MFSELLATGKGEQGTKDCGKTNPSKNQFKGQVLYELDFRTMCIGQGRWWHAVNPPNTAKNRIEEKLRYDLIKYCKSWVQTYIVHKFAA